MIRIGAITLGQSPRVDVMEDVVSILGNQIEVLEAGAMDGLTKVQIQKFAPREGEHVLVSRLEDGSMASFSEERSMPVLQKKVNELEKKGVKLIMVFCTGIKKGMLQSSVPLIYPRELLNSTMSALGTENKMAVIIPLKEQIEQWAAKLSGNVGKIMIYAVSPYSEHCQQELLEVAHKISEEDVDYVLLDCIGYTVGMKNLVRSITGKPVLLGRSLMARIVQELIA